MERINLREQVAWVMERGHEDTQACAEDQVRMALAKLESIKENNPYIPEKMIFRYTCTGRWQYPV